MRKIIKKIFYFIIGFVPKNRRKIVFESGPEFSDSSKVIYDYLLKNRPDYKFVWMVDNPDKFEAERTVFVNVNKQKTFKYLWNVITSKYIFSTNREVRWVDLKKQISVHLTHGLPLKSCKGKLPGPNVFNYLLVTNYNLIPIIADEHCASEDVCFVSGLPRNDLLFKQNEQVEDFIKGYDKVIVWLPTYRKHKNVSIVDSKKYDNVIPLLDKDDLLKLNDILKKYNYLMILKFHPAEDLTNLKSDNYSNINIMSHADLEKLDIHLYSLLAYADALLTDYSSVGLDYILKDKPIGYVLDDFDEYSSARGFCIENFEQILAGPKIINTQNLIEFIDTLKQEKDEFSLKRKHVRNHYHKFQNVNFCEQIVKKFNL